MFRRLLFVIAIFTDTRVPTLWRTAANGREIGAVEPWLDFTGTPLQSS